MERKELTTDQLTAIKAKAKEMGVSAALLADVMTIANSLLASEEGERALASAKTPAERELVASAAFERALVSSRKALLRLLASKSSQDEVFQRVQDELRNRSK